MGGSMKKIGIYFLLFLLFCFCMPIFFTKSFKEVEVMAEEEIKEEEVLPTIQEYKYQNYNTVKLLHTKTGEIEEVNLDEYLCNVVSAEMPVDYELEALKAQAIVARTYTIYKIIHNGGKHEGADICDSSACCQAWISKEDRLARWEESAREQNWNKIVEAVNGTVGKIITYEGEPINAFFHASSGGTTEIPFNVWGGSGYPYLQVVTTAGEEGYSQYSSEVTLTKEELLSKLKEKYEDIEIDFSNPECIKILEYTESGRVRTIQFGNKNLSGVETRTILGLRSANFEVEMQEENIIFRVKGYGHGVGMSQTGADSLAKQGYNYEDIIKHFYVGVEIIQY